MLSIASPSLRRLGTVLPSASVLHLSTSARRSKRYIPTPRSKIKLLPSIRIEVAKEEAGVGTTLETDGQEASMSDWFNEADPEAYSQDSQKEQPAPIKQSDPSRPGPSEPSSDSVRQEFKKSSSPQRPNPPRKRKQVSTEQPTDSTPSSTPPQPSSTGDSPSPPYTRLSRAERTGESPETAQDQKEGQAEETGETPETAHDAKEDVENAHDTVPPAPKPTRKSKREAMRSKYTFDEVVAYKEMKIKAAAAELLAFKEKGPKLWRLERMPAKKKELGETEESTQTGETGEAPETAHYPKEGMGPPAPKREEKKPKSTAEEKPAYRKKNQEARKLEQTSTKTEELGETEQSRQTVESSAVAAEQKPKRALLDGPVVLMLEGASPSLLESDFFRLGRKGQLVDGWVSGLFKVVQAREPITLEPLGQYFLFFDSHAAALQYEDDVRRLHLLDRSMLPNAWKGPKTPFSEATRPLPHMDEDPARTRAAFTLMPPTVIPMLNLQSIEMLWRELSKHSGRLSKGVLSGTYLNKTSSPHSPAESAMDAADGPNDGVTGGPYGYVLDHLNREPLTGENQRVLLSLGKNKFSDAKVREMIEADGARRNLAWRLEPGDVGVQPVNLTGTMPLARQSSPDVDLEAVYGRFVLTFADAIEARRFARCWHKTHIVDRRTERVVAIDVTPLW